MLGSFGYLRTSFARLLQKQKQNNLPSGGCRKKTGQAAET